MLRIKYVTALVILFSMLYWSAVVDGDCDGNVDICDWTPWRAWSDCDRECGGGTKYRDRAFCCRLSLAHSGEKCFADCGMDYESQRSRFSDSKTCNSLCYNGGTLYSWGCSCRSGYIGTCCGDIVSCGRPSSISYGSYSGSTFTYGARVRYSCNTNYGMTDTSRAVRTCTSSGYWSGSAPTCLYAVSCNSGPCKNGARCQNLLGDYRCYCKTGWSGRNCQNDIQPPVVKRCPTDRNVVISTLTTNQTWNEPTIYDPHGTKVRISKNYRASSYEFPWGQYTIQYSGVKPSNGLRAECTFKISVKPFACGKMSPPVNGFLMCNGWRSEYSQICMFECKENHTLPPGFGQRDIYVCGATGNWSPIKPGFECVHKDLFPDQEAGKLSSCTHAADKKALADTYIDRLRASAFSSLCHKYRTDCVDANVVVTC